MPNKPRKPIADMIEELKSWLPNYDHGPKDYPTLLWRILASIPGGDQAEDMGYEAFALGWQEADQLGRVLAAIQDKRDVEDLIAGLVADEEEEGESENEVDEARRRRHPKWNQQMIGNAHVSDGQEGYWAQFPRGTSAKKVLDEFLSTADYSASTGIFTVTATIDEETASVRVGPGGQVLNEARHPAADLTFEFRTARDAAEFTDEVGAFAEHARRSHRVVDVTLDVTRNAEGVRTMARSLNGVESKSTAEHTVRDYVAVDHRGRPLGPPVKDYEQAKRAATKAAGFVKFANGRKTREPRAPRRSSHHRPRRPR